jgi:hypothetical protein
MSFSGRRLRQRDIGELLDETIALYRRNFALFAGIVAVLAVPQALLGVVAAVYSGTFLGGAAILLIFLSTMLYIVMIAALARAISRRYLDETTTIADAYRSIGWSIIVRLVGASVIWFLCIGMSFAFFVIPAIVFAVYWLFVPQVIVLEGVTAANSLGRSWRLVQGSFWRVFGYGIVVFIAYGVLQIGVTQAIGLALSPLGVAAPVLGGLVSASISTLALPFLLGAITLLYYDLRIRKEGFDLEILARALAESPPA